MVWWSVVTGWLRSWSCVVPLGLDGVSQKGLWMEWRRQLYGSEALSHQTILSTGRARLSGPPGAPEHDVYEFKCVCACCRFYLQHSILWGEYILKGPDVTEQSLSRWTLVAACGDKVRVIPCITETQAQDSVFRLVKKVSMAESKWKNTAAITAKVKLGHKRRLGMLTWQRRV